ncbi:hypothetical protein AAFN86_29565 [Roseomonas sp. CAU 1739]|uniref:hypothetical protein n=1 Tax=Roseomonas sp. CAU 1739 TaxID=3140364 RepID=UPI00325A95D6
MSSCGYFRSAAENGTLPSLAELRACFLADEALPEGRRKEWSSAFRSFAKGLGQPMEVISSDPVELRRLLRGVTPAMAGFRPGRWRNVLSLVTTALAHLGIIVVQSRIGTPPSAEWLAILGLLEPGQERHFHAWRFARYCTVRDIQPAAVDDAVLETYLADLEHRSLVAEPVRAAREVARLWNAAADLHPAWPQCRLTVPDHRLTFSPPLSSYPQTLRDDIERWRAWLGGDDPFTNRPFSPLRPASMATRLRQMRAYLGALVESSIDPASMVDLASVVTPAMTRVALRIFWERAGRKSSAHTFQMGALVLQIGKYWAKLPEADVEELRNMMRQLRPAHSGMSPRTEGRLRAAVEDQDRLDRLLTLPGLLMDKACRAGLPGQRLAQMAQTAVLIDILLHLPVRLENLGHLRLGVHLIRGPGKSITVDIPADETKNEMPISGPLPKDVSKRIDFYIDRFRPFLNPTASDWLFPGAVPGQPKTGEGLRSQIRKAAATHCGLILNPHVFRSLTGYLTLRDDRGAHGKVQRILGHKSLATTMAHYSGLEASMAIADYGDLMGTLRADAMARGAYRKKPRPTSNPAPGGKR